MTLAFTVFLLGVIIGCALPFLALVQWVRYCNKFSVSRETEQRPDAPPGYVRVRDQAGTMHYLYVGHHDEQEPTIQ